MVPEQIFPSEDGEVALITNWAASKRADSATMPEPVDSCTITRAGTHLGSCRSTRNGHQQTGKLGIDEDSAFLRAIKEVGSPLNQVVRMAMAAA